MEKFDLLLENINPDYLKKVLNKKIEDEYLYDNDNFIYSEKKIIKMEIDKIRYKLSQNKGVYLRCYEYLESIIKSFLLYDFDSSVVEELKVKIAIFELYLQLPVAFLEELLAYEEMNGRKTLRYGENK